MGDEMEGGSSVMASEELCNGGILFLLKGGQEKTWLNSVSGGRQHPSYFLLSLTLFRPSKSGASTLC